MNKLEKIQKMMTGEVPNAPIAQLLGFSVVEAEAGRVVIGIDVSERLYNPMAHYMVGY